MNLFDVAVIGAGPSGSSAAITLAQMGFQVLLIDRAKFPRDKLCGDFLNPINWPVLQALAIDQELLSCPHVEIADFRLTAADGAEAFTALPVKHGRRFGLGLRRFHLDQVLLERAQRTGVSVYDGVKATRVEKKSTSWRLDMEWEGEHLSARAKVLVGADGRNSTVARQIGVAPVRVTPAAVGFEIQLRKFRGVRDSVEIHQFPGGYAGVVWVDETTVNLCFTAQRNVLGRSLSFESLRASLLRSNRFLDDLLIASEPASELRSVSPVYFPARRSFADRLLLVGDAARVSEPVTGEGIFLALRSGQLAAAAIADGLGAGDLSAHRLRQYQRACRAEFAARLRLNALIRFFIYRPELLSLALRLFGRQRWLFDDLVKRVCLARPALVS
jgi:geranylgeranyl reductase family protein